jgi:hypothetical protein
MHRNIIILITVLLCTEPVFSQEEFARNLLLLEQKAFLCANDTARTDVYLQKFDLYIRENKVQDGAIEEAKRIDYRLLNGPASQERFLWNAALAAQLVSNDKLAAYYYSGYQQVNPDTSVAATLLGALIYMATDSVISMVYTDKLTVMDKRFVCLDCIREVTRYERKHRNLYLLCSALVPGSGSALNGNGLKGATSLLLNGAVAYSVFWLIQNNLYLNAFLLGSALVTKFYLGNIKLTGSLFDQKEERKKNKLATDCELMVSNILLDYPVSFR